MLDNIPCLLIGDELKDSLQVLPEYDRSIMTAPVSDRLISLSNIYDIFYPSPMACEVYYKLYFAFANSIKRKTTSKTAYGISGGTDSFTIIGASGVGKSTAIGRAIKIISNDDILLINNSKVIPFIVVQTPSDASIKGVLLELLRLVDARLETRYYNDAIRSRATLDMLIGLASKVCLNHISVLIFDEIQNITEHKNNRSFVNAIVQLINSSGVSICFVGTPDCNRFFESAFHLARRSIGLTFNAFEYDDNFISMCNTIFRYQYTSKYSPLTQDIVNWLYIHSGGVASVVMGLIASAQEITILSGSDTLNLESLTQAYSERFQMLHSHLNIYHRQKCASQIKSEDTPVDLLTSKDGSMDFSLSELLYKIKKEHLNPLDYLLKYISVEVIRI